MSEPVLRRPTRGERLTFALTKRWPASYVEARLDHLDALERYGRAAVKREHEQLRLYGPVVYTRAFKCGNCGRVTVSALCGCRAPAPREVPISEMPDTRATQTAPSSERASSSESDSS